MVLLGIRYWGLGFYNMDNQTSNMDNQTSNNDVQKEEKPEQKLEEYQKQAEEYLNNWKRERADFINYKKDEAKRLEEFAKFANEGLILEVIEILDDLEIALKHSSSDFNGLNQIMKKFGDWLKKYGVERIKVAGEKFNPELHEAVESSAKEGELEEIRAGYTMHGKVIRPARVKIIKN